jgi:hypothetical protein
MLDLCPRPLLRPFPKEWHSQIARTFTAVAVAGVGLAIRAGLAASPPLVNRISEVVSQLRRITHGGVRCPFCGGTRAFLALFEGKPLDALGYSIFGTISFVLIYASLPLRIWGFIIRRPTTVSLLDSLDRSVERCFLPILFAAYLVQIILDRAGILPWNA